MARRAECERLHQHLVALPYSAGNQRKMHRRRARRQRHDPLMQRPCALAAVDKLLEVLLEPVDIRSQRHNPVLVKRLLYKIHLLAAHMRQAEQYSFHIIVRLFVQYSFAGISYGSSIVGYIVYHHRTSANHAPIPYLYPGNDCCSSPNPCTFSYMNIAT